MEGTGKILQIAQDFENKGIIITLSVLHASVQELQQLKSFDLLSFILKKYRKKRSLDANAYAWSLMSKIATQVGSSKEEIYEEMLQKYGPFYEDEEGYVVVTVKASIDMKKIEGHWKHHKSNGTFSSYLMIKGSSEYDTKEMSHFINQIVDEAKELGIQTETPDEIAKMTALWGKEHGGQ